MKLKYLPFVALLALAVASPSTSEANVYASALSATNAGASFTISFRLNENADAVTVEVLNSSSAVIKTITAGALLKGANTVSWDKTNNASSPAPADTYSFRVIASKTTGYADWTKISDDTSADTQYFSPHGVQVNKNQSSANFGRVYVSENAGAVTSGRNTGTAGVNDGIYVLSSDLTNITGQTTAYASAAGWPASASGPYALALSDDGYLYISDWTDTNAQVWVTQESNLTVANDAGNPPTPLFGPDARIASGVRNNGTADYQGSIATLRVFGTGAGKYLMTLDEDITVAGANPGSLLRYNIGNTVTNYNTVPTVVYNDTTNGNLIQNPENGFSFDSAGNIWISQNRTTDSATVPSLIRYNTTSNTVDFNSFSTVGTPGPFNAGSRGKSEINPAGNLLVLGGSGTLRVLNIAVFPPTLSKTITTADGYTGTNTYQVTWDAAGNLYAVNATAERLRVFSPPGTNTFTTSSPSGVSMVVGSAVSDWSTY